MSPRALGRVIGAEYSPDLSPGSWIDIGSFSELGGNALFGDNDPVRKARPDGYYRAFLRPVAP